MAFDLSGPNFILRRVFDLRIAPISATTRYCAVLGHPIRHSASPAMQNAGMAALGLDWRYLAFDVAPTELRQAIEGGKAMKFLGLNFTVPHKLLALEMVDELDESASEWGAVNTVRFEARAKDGEWQPLSMMSAAEEFPIRSRGFNTDADALVRALREDLLCNLPGSTVLVLGAGGAGRVAALKLAREGVRKLFLVNRTPDKASEVGAEIQRRFPRVEFSIGYPAVDVDLVVNATSLGLQEADPLPIDAARFALKNARSVYDMIYRPAETKLLKAARTAGCRTANGSSMLLYQGAKALELWSGKTAPVEVMRKALEENLYGSS